MKLLLTKRVDGSFRIGDYKQRHFATRLIYSDEEIVASVEVDVPEAYELTAGGYGYRDKYGVGPIDDHPKIRAAMRKL